MSTRFRANAMELQIPVDWIDTTVFNFRSTDWEEKMSLTTEHRERESTLETELHRKTGSMSEGIPGVELVGTGDIECAGLMGKYFLIRGIRGDEVPFVYFGVVAQPGPLEVMVFGYEGPADRWQAAEPRVRALLRTAHFVDR